MEHIAVSVIVPIYNTLPWLDTCVQAILAQEFDHPFEVLLVDDGSTDGCAPACDAYAAADARVRVFHQENQGLSATRNTGIDAARGRYFAFVDSDDVIRPGYLQRLYDACESNDAYMAVCGVEDIAEDGAAFDPPRLALPKVPGVHYGKDLLPNFSAPKGKYYTAAWNKLYRADLWNLLHYPEGRIHEDDFVAHRLYWRCNTVVCLDEVLYCYRVRQGNLSHNDLRADAFDSVDGLADRYRFYLENGADREVIDAAYAACWRRYLFLCGRIRQNPAPALIKAISRQQFVMQGLLEYLPNCKQLKMAQKLSCARWAMMPAESLAARPDSAGAAPAQEAGATV